MKEWTQTLSLVFGDTMNVKLYLHDGGTWKALPICTTPTLATSKSQWHWIINVKVKALNVKYYSNKVIDAFAKTQ